MTELPTLHIAAWIDQTVALQPFHCQNILLFQNSAKSLPPWHELPYRLHSLRAEYALANRWF